MKVIFISIILNMGSRCMLKPCGCLHPLIVVRKFIACLIIQNMMINHPLMGVLYSSISLIFNNFTQFFIRGRP